MRGAFDEGLPKRKNGAKCQSAVAPGFDLDFSSCSNSWSLGLWPLEGAGGEEILPEGLPEPGQLGGKTAE